MNEKSFVLRCAVCYRYFESQNENDKFCPECKKVKANKKQSKTKPFKTIFQVVREMENYNKEHGTKLSYGQYVSSVDK